jgi:uroporphyrinogen decarboxylase
MHFESVDHPPMLLPGGPWPTTRKRWEQEGLPEGADLNEYFGVEPMSIRPVGIETMPFPAFEEKILEETEEFIIKIDRHGVKLKNFKDESSMGEHLEYPIKTPEDISWLKERLDWNTPGRIKENWLEEAEAIRDDGGIVFCNGGMYFAFLNEHMGTDTLLFTYFDHPDFIHQVNDLLCTLCENALKTALPKFKLDRLGYHEDMAYKNGSLISPDMFKEFMTPYYKRIIKITNEYGIDLHLMDSDGDIRELIPLWLECGIATVTPLEVAAGMDVVELRKEYGNQLGMEGGFDKRIMASTKEAIKQEFERLVPVIDGGGYILSCDHGVPHDVSFENYSYLTELLKTHYGIK